MWFIHIACAYFVAISGLLCFITRAVNSLKKYHIWFGRVYIISMLWCTASSLLVHNNGLPLAVLISFGWVLGGMTIAWVLINIHQAVLYRKAVKSVQEKWEQGLLKGDLENLITQEKTRISSSKPWLQRVFSLKGFHGMIMFTSWINITGRIFASDQSGNFTCYTYPVFKPLDSHGFPGAGKNITFIPTRDPEYNRLPWANREATWGAVLLCGPMFASMLVGLVYAFFTRVKRASTH
jgi:hypothetical protein